MIDALIGGRLHGKPAERIGKSGRPFATCKVRVAQAEGDAMFASVIAFSDTTRAALLALGDGDSVAIAGPLTVGTFDDREGTTRPSLSIVAHHVTTSYHVRRKRDAVDAEASR